MKSKLRIMTGLAAPLASLALSQQAHSALVLHLPLNDASSGNVTAAAAAINDPTHPTTAGTSATAGDTWTVDAIRGNVYSTTQGSRINAGTQGIVRADGFSWSVWVNIDPTAAGNTDGGAESIIGTRSASGGHWHKVGFTAANNWADTTYSTFATNSWKFMTYVGDSTNIRMYVDGVLSGTQDTTTLATTFNGNFEIGGTSNFSEDMEGLMSDVGVYNEALTVGEIKSLYDITTAGSGLLNYDVGEFDLLKQVHDTASGSVTIGGLQWNYATGLVGSAGLSESGGSYTLILNAAGGTGLVAIPEPTAALLGSLGLLALLRRRR